MEKSRIGQRNPRKSKRFSLDLFGLTSGNERLWALTRACFTAHGFRPADDGGHCPEADWMSSVCREGTSGGSPHWTMGAHGAWPRLLAVAARSTTLCGGYRVAGLHRLDDGIHDLHGHVGLGTAGVRLAWRPVWSASGCAPRRRLADRLDRRRP